MSRKITKALFALTLVSALMLGTVGNALAAKPSGDATAQASGGKYKNSGSPNGSWD